MAYAPHWLLVLGGIVHPTGGDQDEIWQCTLRGSPAVGGGFTLSDEDDALAAIQGAVNDWWHDSATYSRNDCTLDYLKLNAIGPDGKYSSASASHQHDYPSANYGTTVSNMPIILTLCWSWKTARRRGPGSNGRIYPPIALGSNAGLVVGSAQQTIQLNMAHGLLHAINNPSSGVFVMVPQVASKIDASLTNITSIRVGNVYDVQRRRKDALTETYAEIAWP